MPALAGTLGACAVNPPLDLSEEVTSGATRVALEVPFFPQEENQCGPAALAMVLGASGLEASPDQLAPGVYLPARQGSLQAELMAATRRSGRIPYRLSPAPSALVAELQAGHPVLVLQNLRVRSWPAWHYAVLTGFDAASNTFRLNSGDTEDLEMSGPHFLRTWNWGGSWAMVALVPGELPSSAEPSRYFESVSDFESVAGAQSATQAWRAGASRWPADPLPDLALGNVAYARSDLNGAASHYADGLSKSPVDPVLANNLATVLGEMGCPRLGERVLMPVAAEAGVDSGWADNMKETLHELEAQTGDDPPDCAALRPGGAP